MRVLVLGGGVIGVTAAWYLAADGHEVTLLERREAPALETSFANGGQISASHAEPWANPRAPVQVLRWLGRKDAPLLFRLRADVRQWRWGLAFLLECLPSRSRRNTIECFNLARYSLACLRELCAQAPLAFDRQTRGILEFHADAREFERAAEAAALLREFGCDRVAKSRDECVAIEPAFAACRDRIAGGIHSASDESGDAQAFTAGLAQLGAARGIAFRFGVTVRALEAAGDAIAAVHCVDAEGRAEALAADAIVVALGSYSPLVLAPLGVPCPVYPTKGYSVTLDVGSHRGAPTVSLTDPERKLVTSRLGGRLRVAGTAELTGWNTDLDDARCAALVRRTFELFPDAADRESARFWAGLRPATPSNVPLIGRTRYRNLWLDTGHGTLGWTLACGSGRALADRIAGRAPEVDFAFVDA